MTEIFGQHTGENLASYVCDIIEEYGVAGKLFCITAENASNNRTLARALEKRFGHYSASQNMLGCVGHVVNLAAKAAFKAVGHIVKEEFNLSNPAPFADAEALQVCKLTNLKLYLS